MHFLSEQLESYIAKHSEPEPAILTKLTRETNQIVQHVGDSLNIIPKLDAVFDLIFIDAEKASYDAYFEAVLPKTKSGSIILSDNVLWSGKVVEPVSSSDKATKSLLAFNKKLKEDKRIETVLLPIRDGLTLSRVL